MLTPAPAPIHDVVDDLIAAETMADPHRYFAWLRAEDPVHWDRRSRAWVVTRYDDVLAGLRDERLSSARAAGYFATEDADAPEDAFAVLSQWMVFKDPPNHGRLRRLIQKAFATRAIEALRPRAEALVAGLLEPLADVRQFDFMTEVASPYPALMIAEMLGIPAADRALFQRWSEELAALVLGSPGGGSRYDRAREGLSELIAYFEALIDDYRRHPADNLISALIETEDGGDVLTREEILGTCTLTLFAGHETTTDLLGNGTLALIHHPDERQLLVSAPAVARPAVEELLRYEGPSKMQSRTARNAFTFGGKDIAAGDRVLLAMASANRDATRFDEPDRLHLLRSDNAHLGFGFGLHYCLGAALARLEAQVLLPAMFRRFPTLGLATENLAWKPRIITRGLQALPLTTETTG